MLSTRTTVLACAIGTLAAAPVRADEFEERVTFDADRLLVANVVGAVRVEAHSGSGFEVVVSVKGSDATRQAAAIERRDGAEASLDISFPDEHRFSYPELRRRTRVKFSFDPEHVGDDSFIDGVFRRARARSITVTGGSGFEAWADLVIRVPRGGEIVVRNGVGHIEVENVSGAVDVSTHYGDALVASVTGDTRIDTGNGDVDARDIEGSAMIDTGNGDIDLLRAKGETVKVDSGNGHIVADEITCTRLEIDTGNGRIDASRLRTESARLDTGNGAIELDLDEIGEGRFVVDTGNGSIDLRLPPTASVDVEADTGHGSVRLDVDDDVVEVLHRRRDNVRFRMGEGTARIRLDSGNGSIHIST